MVNKLPIAALRSGSLSLLGLYTLERWGKLHTIWTGISLHPCSKHMGFFAVQIAPIHFVWTQITLQSVSSDPVSSTSVLHSPHLRCQLASDSSLYNSKNVMARHNMTISINIVLNKLICLPWNNHRVIENQEWHNL